MNYDVGRIDIAINNLGEAVNAGIDSLNLTSTEKIEVRKLIDILESISDSIEFITRA